MQRDSATRVAGGDRIAISNSPLGTRPRPSRIWLGLAFFAIYVVWGTTYLAIRFAIETIPPLVTVGLRHSTAGLILLGIAWSRGFRSFLMAECLINQR